MDIRLKKRFSIDTWSSIEQKTLIQSDKITHSDKIIDFNEKCINLRKRLNNWRTKSTS